MTQAINVTISRAFLGFSEATMSPSRWKKLRDACPPHVQKKILPALIQHLQERLPGILEWTLVSADEREDATQLTLLFQYPTVFAKTSGYVRPVVKIEFGGRTDSHRRHTMEELHGLFRELSFPVDVVVTTPSDLEKRQHSPRVYLCHRAA